MGPHLLDCDAVLTGAVELSTWAAMLQHVEKLNKFLPSNMYSLALGMLIAVDTHEYCSLTF